MPVLTRPRWLGFRKAVTATLTVALLLVVGACAEYPNSVFHNRTEFNRDVGDLFRLIIWLGLAVFVFVEVLLIWVMIKYRARPGQPDPEHVHGNTTLEITWTVIPALILLWIAVPTVQSIFRTQAPARSDALQVEVIGHQWWWEFRYPQYGIITANEVYLPLGRTVNFTLKSKDVIHSFWIPSMGGKRDLMANRTNYLWFTPDSTDANAWNGFCVEYCGASHANMRFRAFTVDNADFESWAAHQQTPAVVLGAAGTAAPGTAGAAGAATATAGAVPPTGAPASAATTTGQVAATVPEGAAQPGGVVQTGFISFSLDRMPEHAKPNVPIPSGIPITEGLIGDPARGQALFSSSGTCFACHTVRGLPGPAIPPTAPDLTHIASRTTIGAGLYPNDTRHLTAWITNSTVMKPGSKMPPILRGQRHGGSGPPGGMLDAQQIADVVAYLQTLK